MSVHLPLHLLARPLLPAPELYFPVDSRCGVDHLAKMLRPQLGGPAVKSTALFQLGAQLVTPLVGVFHCERSGEDAAGIKWGVTSHAGGIHKARRPVVAGDSKPQIRMP